LEFKKLNFYSKSLGIWNLKVWNFFSLIIVIWNLKFGISFPQLLEFGI
jgi:hypothetical protein